MTGFAEMIEIRKAYRTVSVNGCEVIGAGANGKVYRIDPDTIIKVYRNPDALPEIRPEAARSVDAGKIEEVDFPELAPVADCLETAAPVMRTE